MEFTARVERLVKGGRGLLRREDGRVLLVDGAAPGDVALFEEEGGAVRLLEVLEASSDRVKPLCRFFGRCGGCALQHISYAAQVREKTGILSEAFTRIGGFAEAPRIRVVTGEAWGYRNRIQLHRDLATGRVGFLGAARDLAAGRVGFPGAAEDGRGREAGARGAGEERLRGGAGRAGGRGVELVPVDDCPVADEAVREALRAGDLAPPPDLDRFTVFGSARDGVLLSEGGSSRGKIRLRAGGEGPGAAFRDITLEAGLFFQSNLAMLDSLVSDLAALVERSGAPRPECAADLYCGVGTFAALLGPAFSCLDLVEEHTASLALARLNVPGGEGREVRFFAGSVENWLKRGKPRRHYDFIVADPPRAGLAPSVRAWLRAVRPAALAYVSCDPAALARDSRDLAAGGLRLDSLTFYDFYPQTAHVESLAVFTP